MPLRIYRRHGPRCKAGKSEYDPWMKCSCPIHVEGTPEQGGYLRRSTGTRCLERARKLAVETERLGHWPEESQDEDQPELSGHGVTVAEATESFIANRLNRGIEPPTLAKYQTFVKQLRAYCDDRGYRRLTELTVTDMDRFYTSWKDGKRSRAKKLERLKGFVKFCLKRKWLTENLAEDLEAPEGSSIPSNKMPFTDEELGRIYDACDALGGATPPGPGCRNWGGEDAKDFIMLSIYTGLRISDVATFDISRRLKGNDVFLRMHKTKKELFTWIPDWLVERLRARERIHGPLIFRYGASTVMRSMAEGWRVKLEMVFKRAGKFDERAIPHRFRHTFVRILLESGVPIADVAELIGDTEEVVRRHYAKWVPERQARLTRILQKALAAKKPNL